MKKIIQKLKPRQGKISIILFALVLLAILIVSGFLVFKKVSKPQNEITGQVLATYSLDKEVKILTKTTDKGNNLPENLVIAPGIYQIFGQSYNLLDEGLYRFIVPGEANAQRIVYRSDVKALLSGLAWSFSHGTVDGKLTNQELEKKLLTTKAVATCGKISSFALEILKNNNIEAREVSGLTAEEYNGFDDAHVLIEVKLDGVWQVYDLDSNAVFTKNRQYLNFYDWSKLIASGDYQIERIAADSQLDVSGFKEGENNYDYTFYAESQFYSDTALKNWYKRVLAIPFIRDGSTRIYFGGDETKVTEFDPKTRKVGESEFKAIFYP